jgi:hypothetical protein
MSYSTPFQAAFKSKVRLIDNSAKQEENPKAPPQKLAMDLSVESAAAMAKWLNDKIAETKNNGSTIREYKGQNDYTETPGFTMWGSMWDKSGTFSPGVVKQEDEL